MLHLMRQALADTAATGQDDRPAAGGDVDMVDQGAAAPDPEVPTGVSLSKAQNESLAKMTGERKRQLLQIKTADEMGKMQPVRHGPDGCGRPARGRDHSQHHRGKHTRQTVTYPHNRGVHTRNRWRDLHGRHTRRPESERRAHTSGGTAARTCARAAVRGATTTGARRAMPRRARGSRPGSRITYGSAHA